MQWPRVALAVVVAATAVAVYEWRSGKQPSTAATAQLRSCRLAPAGKEHPGMVWVAGATFSMGSNSTFPEEAPQVAATVSGFWMDQTEVTNAQFAEFIAATGYRTLSERGLRRGDAPDAPVVPGSAVFRPRGDAYELRSFVNWWQFEAGADWRHPDGANTSIEGMEQHPVVHVTYEDALAYAQWKGRALPTEEQFEWAAQSSARRSSTGHYTANSWQGTFPSLNTAADGYAGTSPVGCFEANKLGLHDLVGNVWEWTASPYYDRHDAPDRGKHPQGFDPMQPQEKAVAVLKGGSYLCSPEYCMRYRAQARIGQSVGLGASHIGFRTVRNR
jgi:formylglycine-generating enzyme